MITHMKFIRIMHTIIPLGSSRQGFHLPSSYSKALKVQRFCLYKSLILFGTILLTRAICEASPLCPCGLAMFYSLVRLNVWNGKSPKT